MPSFGASTRAQRALLFMGSDMQAPGSECPAKYDLRPAIGEQVHSTRCGRNASMPRPIFSRASRWAYLEREERHNTVPGPGAYG